MASCMIFSGRYDYLSWMAYVQIQCRRHRRSETQVSTQGLRVELEEWLGSRRTSEAATQILSFPTVKSLSGFTFGSEIDLFSMFQSSLIFLQTFASAFILLKLPAVFHQ